MKDTLTIDRQTNVVAGQHVGQHADYVEVLCVRYGRNEHRLRVVIHADTSYKTQSHAKVEHWDGKWIVVADLLSVLVRNDIRIPADFNTDRDKLLKLARSIVGDMPQF